MFVLKHVLLQPQCRLCVLKIYGPLDVVDNCCNEKFVWVMVLLGIFDVVIDQGYTSEVVHEDMGV